MADMGCERTESEVKQIIFILERLELIAMEPKGNQRFYIAIKNKEYVKFSYRDDHFDSIRFRMDLLSKYQKEDIKRFRAIQEARKRYA